MVVSKMIKRSCMVFSGLPNCGWTDPPRVAEAAECCTNCGVWYLAREAQREAQRERAGQGEAKEGHVAVRVHDKDYSRLGDRSQLEGGCALSSQQVTTRNRICPVPSGYGWVGASSLLDLAP
jgi:hypothetical protein